VCVYRCVWGMPPRGDSVESEKQKREQTGAVRDVARVRRGEASLEKICPGVGEVMKNEKKSVGRGMKARVPWVVGS